MLLFNTYFNSFSLVLLIAFKIIIRNPTSLNSTPQTSRSLTPLNRFIISIALPLLVCSPVTDPWGKHTLKWISPLSCEFPVFNSLCKLVLPSSLLCDHPSLLHRRGGTPGSASGSARFSLVLIAPPTSLVFFRPFVFSYHANLRTRHTIPLPGICFEIIDILHLLDYSPATDPLGKHTLK